jgi:hypothetical protein
VAGGGFQCNVTGTLQLTQSGKAITGSYSGLEADCVTGSDFVAQYGSGQISKGSLNGNSITFDLAGANWHHTGTVLPDLNQRAMAMQGAVTGGIDFGSPYGSMTFQNDTWNAAR